MTLNGDFSLKTGGKHHHAEECVFGSLVLPSGADSHRHFAILSITRATE